MMHGVKIDNSNSIQQKGIIISLQRSTQNNPNQVKQINFTTNTNIPRS
jgi:hypothetical protein